MTTTQTSVTEWLDAGAPRADHDGPQNSTTTPDASTPVHLSNEKYHRDVAGVPACPGVRQHLRKGTLQDAAAKKLDACSKCQPVRYQGLEEP
jgi:hypothetical protein